MSATAGPCRPEGGRDSGPALFRQTTDQEPRICILRIPLVAGRIWNDAENRNGARVAVINQALAKRYFPDGGALGRSLKLPQLEEDSPGSLSSPKVADSSLQVVGIVGNARNDGILNPVAPAVFIPYTLHMWRWTQLLVKTWAPPLNLLRAVRLQPAAVDPDQQSASRIEDLESWIVNLPEWQQHRLAAWLFGAFGALALALAAIGLYSVVSYTVTQRTNEFGVRMALGAQGGHVMRIVFATTLWAKGSSRDPDILFLGILLLGLVSAVASALPAWKASRLDPTTALRRD